MAPAKNELALVCCSQHRMTPPQTLECWVVKRQTGKPYFSLYYPVWSCVCSKLPNQNFPPVFIHLWVFKALRLSLVFSLALSLPLLSMSFYKRKTMPVRQGSSKQQGRSCLRQARYSFVGIKENQVYFAKEDIFSHLNFIIVMLRWQDLSSYRKLQLTSKWSGM